MWIAKADYGVPRVEFDLDEPIRYLGGFLATVRETAGRVEYVRVEPDVWLPIEFELELDQGCQLYYRGSVCDLDPELADQSPQTVARILEQCERLRARAGEHELAGASITDVTLNRRFRQRPYVGVLGQPLERPE